jgi:hypothetical protein
MIMFDQKPCTERTLLGACKEQGGVAGSAAVSVPVQAPRVLQVQPEPDSPLIATLKQRSADNAEKNAREVKEITLSACEPAVRLHRPSQIGPRSCPLLSTPSLQKMVWVVPLRRGPMKRP